MFRKHDAWVETLVVVDGSAAKRRAEREASQARRSLTQASAPGSPTAGGKNKTSSASGVQGAFLCTHSYIAARVVAIWRETLQATSNMHSMCVDGIMSLYEE